MALQRPPGSTARLEQGSSKYFSDRASFDGGASWISLAGGSQWTLDEIDVRPTYQKGVVITLPGSNAKFRLSTSYSHESWKVGSAAPAYYKGFQWPYAFLREAVDAGRDSQTFLAGLPRISEPIPTDMENEAVTKALLKLADSTANMGENLATFAQTFRLFAGKTSILYEALKAAKDRKSWSRFLDKSARDLGRAGPVEVAAQLYLEYVYGLKPLAQDVYNLYEKLRKEAGEPLYYHGKGKSTRTSFKRNVPLAASYSYQERRNWTCHQKANARITARIDPEWAVLRSLNQLGLLNPAALAWELVPWSFVVDWILPIGSVLNAYSASAGLIFVDGYVACKTTENHQLYYGLVPEGGYAEQNGTHKPSLYPIDLDGYARKAFTSWPRPGLWVDHDPLRGDRVFKALALGILSLK